MMLLLGSQIGFLLPVEIRREKRDKQGADYCVGMSHAAFGCKE
jgi:hypothetical protein